MAGAIIAEAVMHCNLQESKKIIAVAGSVLQKMYVAGSPYIILPNIPPVTQAALLAQHDLAQAKQELVESGGSKQDTIVRNNEVKILFTMLNPTLITWVNGLYKGDATNLGKSGFDVLQVSEQHEIPDAPGIDRVDDGPVELSAKIFLAQKAVPPDRKKEVTTYIVQVSDDNGATFQTVLAEGNSHKLILTGLVHGKEILIRVAGHNAHGTSPFSDDYSFLPRRK